MCGYHIPDAVRQKTEQLLDRGITDPAVIAGQLHDYSFAVEISNRIAIINEIKDDYNTSSESTNTDDAVSQESAQPFSEQHSISSEPLSDTTLEHALDNSIPRSA